MNAAYVFALLEKGLKLLPFLIAAGADVITLIDRLRSMAKRAGEGLPVTDDELTSLEADLDAKLAEFNAPLPDA
jgi:hypothetical protein